MNSPEDVGVKNAGSPRDQICTSFTTDSLT